MLTNIHCFFTRKSGKRLAPCARRKPRGPRPLRKRVCEEAVAGLGEAGTNRGQRRQRPRLQERRGVPSRSRRRRLDGCVPPRFQQLATGPGTRETARSEIAPRNHRQTGSLRGRAGSPSTPLQTRSAILRIAASCAATMLTRTSAVATVHLLVIGRRGWSEALDGTLLQQPRRLTDYHLLLDF